MKLTLVEWCVHTQDIVPPVLDGAHDDGLKTYTLRKHTRENNNTQYEILLSVYRPAREHAQ